MKRLKAFLPNSMRTPPPTYERNQQPHPHGNGYGNDVRDTAKSPAYPPSEWTPTELYDLGSVSKNEHVRAEKSHHFKMSTDTLAHQPHPSSTETIALSVRTGNSPYGSSGHLPKTKPTTVIPEPKTAKRSFVGRIWDRYTARTCLNPFRAGVMEWYSILIHFQFIRKVEFFFHFFFHSVSHDFHMTHLLSRII